MFGVYVYVVHTGAGAVAGEVVNSVLTAAAVEARAHCRHALVNICLAVTSSIAYDSIHSCYKSILKMLLQAMPKVEHIAHSVCTLYALSHTHILRLHPQTTIFGLELSSGSFYCLPEFLAKPEGSLASKNK